MHRVLIVKKQPNQLVYVVQHYSSLPVCLPSCLKQSPVFVIRQATTSNKCTIWTALALRF